MAWPYRFLTLSKEEVQVRRESLDAHACFAQITALLPILLIPLARLLIVLAQRIAGGRGGYNALPASPSRKAKRQTASGASSLTLRKVTWWLESDFVFLGQSRGQRDQWVFGGLWFGWLLTMCIVGTGDGEL
jgi:hypothetical protein